MNTELDKAQKTILEFEQLAKKWKKEFMRRTFELLSIVDISKGVTLHLNIGELADLILNTIRGYIKAQSICFFLRNDNKPDEFILIDSAGLSENAGEIEFVLDESLFLKTIVSEMKILRMSEIENDPAYKNDIGKLKRLNAILALPLLSQKKLKGFLIVGPKAGNTDYTQADEDFLVTIGNLSIMGIENVQYLEMIKQTLWRTICIFINMLESKHPYLMGHAQKVTSTSLKIAEKIGLEKDEIEILKYSAMMHDIGLVGVSEYILYKPEKLTEQEFDIVRKHPDLSSEILAPIDFFNTVREIIVQHHEWFNGKGYPKKLKENEILVQARIISVADAYEALRADRPYRKAVSQQTAINEIKKCSGIQFDPKIVEALLKVCE